MTILVGLQIRGVLNEDGEPIIEINEPAHDNRDEPLDGTIPEDPPLKPLHTLPVEEKSQRKAEMDRILDALEEEEEQEARAAVKAAKEKNRTFLMERKRESERLARATEESKKRDKKMGKALLSALGSSSSASSPPSTSAPKSDPSNKSVKKSVTFEEPDGKLSQPESTVKTKAELGDVLAALPSSSSRRLMQNTPIKADVVERFPATSSSRPAQATSFASQLNVDSDDEDNEPVSAFGKQQVGSENEFGDQVIETDELDLTDTRHQEQIAAEYRSLRESVINKSVFSEAVQSSSVAGKSNPWDKELVPLDATLAHDPHQAKGSRFKASRQQTFASISGEGSVLPASMLRGAVRMGKLQKGELVGDEGDSEDDLVADVEEKLAIEKAKQRLVQSPDAGINSDPRTPILDNPRSSPKLPADESKMTFATSTSSPLNPPSGSTLTGTIKPPGIRDRDSARGFVPSPAQLNQGPGSLSMIIESPSFAPSSRVSKEVRSPSVMMETVRESSPRQNPARSTPQTVSGPPKVSRFKAARS